MKMINKKYRFRLFPTKEQEVLLNKHFPKFKSKKRKNTFTIPQFGKLEDGKIIIPKFKDGIEVKLHGEVKGKIGKMTITKTPTGKYYVSIFTEQEVEELPKTNKLEDLENYKRTIKDSQKKLLIELMKQDEDFKMYDL